MTTSETETEETFCLRGPTFLAKSTQGREEAAERLSVELCKDSTQAVHLQEPPVGICAVMCVQVGRVAGQHMIPSIGESRDVLPSHSTSLLRTWPSQTLEWNEDASGRWIPPCPNSVQTQPKRLEKPPQDLLDLLLCEGTVRIRVNRPKIKEDRTKRHSPRSPNGLDAGVSIPTKVGPWKFLPGFPA